MGGAQRGGFVFVSPEDVVLFVEEHAGCTAEDVDEGLHLKNAYTRLADLAGAGRVHCEEVSNGTKGATKHWFAGPAPAAVLPDPALAGDEDLGDPGDTLSLKDDDDGPGDDQAAAGAPGVVLGDIGGGSEEPPADRDRRSTTGRPTAQHGAPEETPKLVGTETPPRAGRPSRSDNRFVPFKDRALAFLAKIAPRGCSLKGLATALKTKTTNLSGPLAKLCEGDQVHCTGAGTRGKPRVYYWGPALASAPPAGEEPAQSEPAVLTTDNGVRASLVVGAARITIEVPLHCPEPDVRRTIRLLQVLLETQLEE